MRVRLMDADGKVYVWTVIRVARAWNCGIPKPRYVSGWEYTSNDGCARFAEGNWMELVAAFRLTASNYGMTMNIS